MKVRYDMDRIMGPELVASLRRRYNELMVELRDLMEQSSVDSAGPIPLRMGREQCEAEVSMRQAFQKNGAKFAVVEVQRPDGSTTVLTSDLASKLFDVPKATTEDAALFATSFPSFAGALVSEIERSSAENAELVRAVREAVDRGKERGNKW